MSRSLLHRRANARVRSLRSHRGSVGYRTATFRRLLLEHLEDRRLLSSYQFEHVFKELVLGLPDGSVERVLMNGMAEMSVDVDEAGKAEDQDGDERDQVTAELTKLDLTGMSSFGEVQVGLSATQPSVGEIEERENIVDGRLDMPPFTETGQAESFFDVFVEIEIGGQLFHTAGPEHVQATISAVPPAPGDTYWMMDEPIALLDANGNPTSLSITSQRIILQPTRRIEVFPHVQKELVWRLPDGKTDRVLLSGTAAVAMRTDDYGTATDTDGDGLDQVPTTLVELDLRGTSSRLGPVQIGLNPLRPSLGEIEERSNFRPGTLDLPPFAMEGLADSFFDVFVEIEVGGQVLQNLDAERLHSVISHAPSAPGETYLNPVDAQPIPLVDAEGQDSGIWIVDEQITLDPDYVVQRFPFVQKELVLQTPQGVEETVRLSGTAMVKVATDGSGWAADSDGDGRDQVPMELVELNLVGTSSLGPVHFSLDPSKRSFGEIEEQVNNTPGVLDLPPFTKSGVADSFFDVWPEVVIPGQVLYTETPERLSAELTQLPPAQGETYVTPLDMRPIALIDVNGQLSGYSIVSQWILPNPEHEVDHFPHIRKELVLMLPTGARERVLLRGTGIMEVAIDVAGAATDTDGDGRDQVAAVWTDLDLWGTSSLGPVAVRLDPTRWSRGEIEELVNNNPGTLDLPPFTETGTAFSFFDVFMQIEIGGDVMVNADPERLRAIITHKPPAPGETYSTPPDMVPIPLVPLGGVYYDEQNPQIWIVSERLTPIPAGSIRVVKDAQPDDPQDFSFLSPELGAFQLDDDGDPVLPNSRTFNNLAPGVYKVVEQPVDHWNLSSLVIDDPDGGSHIDLSTGTATIDLDPGESITVTFTNRPNQPPVANAGGPYVVDEGGSVQLDASNSDDDVGIVRYEWDFDYDGVYEEEGIQATFSAEGLDGPADVTVGLRVTDDDELTHTATVLVHVRNVAPTVSDLELTPQIDEGDTATLSGTVSDPCADDVLTLELDWGDGSIQSIDLIEPLPVGVTYDATTGAFTVQHTYFDDGPSPGNGTSSDLHAVTGRVVDDDGGWAPLLQPVGPRIANDRNDTGWSVTQQIQVGEPIGQTFTAISNNPLATISFYVADMNASMALTDDSLTFELYEGIGTSGQLLGRREYTGLMNDFEGFIHVDFSSVTLVDGQMYTAVLTNDTPRWGRRACGNQYAGGTAIYAGAPSPTSDALFIVQWQPDAPAPRIANEVNATGWSVTQQIQVGEPIGQTFRAISDNRLSTISFYVADMNASAAPTDYSLTFELYEGVGTGGRLLGRREYTGLSDNFEGFIEVDFSSVTLVDGQMYTAVLDNDTQRWGRRACGNQYAGGTAIYAGAASPTSDALFIVQWQPDSSPPRISNDDNATGWSVTQQIRVGEPIGQTFQAISDNRLDTISFYVADMNAGIAPDDDSLTFELYEGVGVSGRLLGRREYTGLTDDFEGFIEADFSSVTLVAGQMYTAVLTNDTARWGRRACGNQYAGGTALYAGAPSPTSDALFVVQWQADSSPPELANDDNDTGWSVTQQILAGEPLGQTFAAISDNRLDTISFYVADMNASAAPDDDSVTFALYEGVGTGGRLLGAREYTGLSDDFEGFVSVDFSAVTLVDGGVYTAVLTNDTQRWGRKACGNQYAGGTALYANSPSPTSDALFRVRWQPDGPTPQLSNDDNDTGWSVTQQILVGEPIGQTFTAISDQRLTNLSFYVADMNASLAPEDHSVTFELYEGEGTSGRLLGRRESPYLPHGFRGFVGADFRAVTLVAGQAYTMVLTNDTARWGRVAIGNQYAGGASLYAGAPSPTADAMFRVGWQPAPSVLVVEVHNVAPLFDVGADVVLEAGAGEFSRTIEFADPGVLDHHTVTVDYGDGSPVQTIDVPLGDRQFTLTHTYADAGNFIVTVTLADDDLGLLSDSFTVAVRFWDWGDAPDSTSVAGYPTLAAHNGARHKIRGPWLGDASDRPDAEPDGQPHPHALGDDLSPTGVTDDEDGVVFPPLVVGQTNYVFIQVHTDATMEAYVDGWIDFNGDKQWAASERFVGGMFGHGVHHVPVAVPADAVPGATFARVRISSTGDLEPTGPADSGEVEDHEVHLIALPENTKWVQLPDLSPNGIDVRMDAIRMLADDFECRATSLLTDVHLWGSWKHDEIGEIQNIEIRIHPDDPVGPAGTDLQNEYSKPDPEVLWAMDFGPEDFQQKLYYTVPEPGEFWWDPLTNELVPGGDSQVWQIDIQIDPAKAFLQRGTADKPVIYWLDVRVTAEGGQFGWKTRQWPDHFMDDAVWTTTMPPWYWQELRYPEGHPYHAQDPNSIDLAFALTFEGLSALIDWGDAPEVAGTAGYPTTKAKDGARHVIRGPWLGDASDRPDHEPDGQPDANALGDDLLASPAYDDEDGIIIPPLVRGQTNYVTFEVSLPPTGMAQAWVDGWIDYNGDKAWDATEQFVSGWFGSGTHTVAVTPPLISAAAVDTTFARVRINSQGPLGPTGLARDGEVEDHEVQLVSLDWGDAPDSMLTVGYPTLAINNGARHVIRGPWLGDRSDGPDGELDGQPHPHALGDDLHLVLPDDEDGVVIPPLVRGQTTYVTFEVSLPPTGMAQAWVDGWIDYNSDRAWDNTEHFVSGWFTQGVHTVAVTPPVAAVSAAAGNVTSTFARVRINSLRQLGPTGGAMDGEVEDHEVQLVSLPSNTKWVQLPDLSPNGIDVRVDDLRIAADDFLCQETSLLTDVHLWGSWKGDEEGEIQNIHLSIHADDPVGETGADPANTFSKPDPEVLWAADFGTDEFKLNPYYKAPEPGEYWWDPHTEELIEGGDRIVWQIDIPIDPREAFLQRGSEEQPIIYWLDVRVTTEGGNFGWKTRQGPDHFMDDAVWDWGTMLPRMWQELRYPEGHPYHGLEEDSIDLAFALTFGPVANRLDWGDAPDSMTALGYPTLAVNNGARHVIQGPWLGDATDNPDAEPDGQPHLNALGDDLSPSPVGDDEDGVVIPPLVVGQTNYVTFEVSLPPTGTAQAYVDGWIDFNGNKQWEAAEQFVSGWFGPGQYSRPVTPPANSVLGQTFARVRINSRGPLLPTGPAADGEVEDHVVRLVALPENTKWVQLPDLSPNGIDVKVDDLRIAADDFLCTDTSLLTDVHLWGSWKDDWHGRIENIHLSIHADDPVGSGGSNPDNAYSMPEAETLWSLDVGPGEFREKAYYTLPAPGEYWWDTRTGELLAGGDRRVWQIDIPIDPREAFLQTGTEDAPVIYWLDVSVKTEGGEFGWKTRQWPEHFMDDAVWDAGSELPRMWKELRYPEGHPYHKQDPNSIDLAFALTFQDMPDQLDWGDAPEAVSGVAGYPTTLLNNGARHAIAGPWLGDANDQPDAELDGQPHADALGDDLSPSGISDDEDGVTIPPLVIGQKNYVFFEVQSPSNRLAHVDGWIDFNADKTWQASEQFVSGWFAPGVHKVAVTPPNASVDGETFARVRINSRGPLKPTGLASDGEVEDHKVRLVALPENTKWVQLPDLSSNGIDVFASNVRMLADDFECRATSLLTDVHLWGSWKDDQVGTIERIRLSIHPDDPVGPDGTDTANEYSKPENEVLWSMDFDADEFGQHLYYTLPEPGEYWWDPATGELVRDGDNQVWQIDIPIEPSEAFLQQGSADRPVIYWLDVQVTTLNGEFGWKTRQWPEHFMDDAVWTSTMPPWYWQELRYPEGHPYHGLERDSIDMAFALTFQGVSALLDWGDAPQVPGTTGYPTTFAANGARHVLRGPWLGDATDNPDAELDGQPEAHALGDDLTPGVAGDDEDGVVIPPLVRGQTNYVTFEVSLPPTGMAQAWVDGWIDYNSDRTWDSTEQFVSGWFGPGVHTVAVTPPLVSTGTAAATFARVRINSFGPLSPKGLARDGEVEDHEVHLVDLPQNVKWVQLPDLSPHGIDVRVDDLRIAADDFLCQETSLLTDVHLWGSWKKDVKGEIQNIHLSIHADDPVGEPGVDPANEFSQPAPEELWSANFGPGQFGESLYYTLPEPGEYWWDPASGELLAGGDRKVWKIDIEIDPREAFLQEGKPDAPVIYWLDVRVATEGGEFGWKTRQWPEHFMDDAVWDYGSELPRTWEELRYPEGHPYSGQDPNSIDLAFALTFQEVAQLDWGDAPDSLTALGYPTLAIHNGARHALPGPWLGDRTDMPDAEPDGQPHPNALGDDFNPAGSDDEDGVVIPPLVVGQVNYVFIEVQTLPNRSAYVDGWIDFNGNKQWEAAERFVSGWFGPGMHTVAVTPPASSVLGQTFARVRINSRGPLKPLGPAADGEVEDHVVRLVALPENVKWVQLPDLSPRGIDIQVDGLRVAADDFECREPGLLTGVRLWGSWKDDLPGRLEGLRLSIHRDDPAGPAGADPGNQFSQPDPDVLWSLDVGPGQYAARPYYTLPAPGEYWWDPLTGELLAGADRRVWQIDVPIDPEVAFLQRGTEEQPMIYWLEVRARTEWGEFGWKTRQWPDHFMDDAVWDVGSELPRIWKELRFPEGHPYYGLEKDSIDLAFALNFQSVVPLDWGDAPDNASAPQYPTLAIHNGARHVATGPMLGNRRDIEMDGQPTPWADGDDTDWQGDDEDGVVFVTPFVPGKRARVTVTASAPGLLNAWIDWNRDGDWKDAGEQVFRDRALVAGANTLSIRVPSTAVVTSGKNASFARFRFSSQPGLSYYGLAPDGEVEDYRITIQPAPAADVAGRYAVTGDWWVAQSNGVDGFVDVRDGRWSPQVTWVDVMVGDFTDNGLDDIVGRNAATGEWWVAVNDGMGGFIHQRWGRWSTAVDWLDVAVGDFNGDGRADIAGRVASTGEWYVAQSTGSSLVSRRWGRWGAGASTWTDVLVGDFNYDGRDDLAGRHVGTGDWWVALANNTGDGFINQRWGRWNTSVQWLDVQVGDFNFDGRDDLVGRMESTGDWWVARSISSGFVNERWGRWSAGSDTWTDVVVGDFNRDGRDDLAGRHRATGDWWVGLAKSTADGFISQRWGRWSPSVSWLDVQVGDFNGDGYADLVGRVASNGEWWVARSTGTGLANERWGRWAAGANTWVDVLVGNFAPTPVSAPDAAQESSAAVEERPAFTLLGSLASEFSPSGQHAEPYRFSATGSPRTEFRDSAAARVEVLDSVMQELPYLRLAADGDSARLTPTVPSGIRRLIRAGEPTDWESLLDDQMFDLLRLDAYFAALG